VCVCISIRCGGSFRYVYLACALNVVDMCVCVCIYVCIYTMRWICQVSVSDMWVRNMYVSSICPLRVCIYI